MGLILPDNRTVSGELTADITASMDAQFLAIAEDIAHYDALPFLQGLDNNPIGLSQCNDGFQGLTSAKDATANC
jgi:hypothetical protein